LKAITVCQPYATLVAILAKLYETRGWATKYRGPLAIHAAAAVPAWAVTATMGSPEIRKALTEAGFQGFAGGTHRDRKAIRRALEQLPLGAVVAMCEVTDCLPTSDLIGHPTAFVEKMCKEDDPQLHFGDFSPDRFAWLLGDVKPLENPATAKGKQGFWNWEPTP